MYFYGYGVKQNYSEAAQWSFLGAKQGNRLAFKILTQIPLKNLTEEQSAFVWSVYFNEAFRPKR